MGQQLRVVVALLAASATSAGCGERSEATCITSKAFDGVYLDHSVVGSASQVTGEVCLDEDCRALSEWTGLGIDGPGQVSLALNREQRDVRLRLELSGPGPTAPVRADRRVELLPVFTADRDCGVYGYSRVVTLNADGTFALGGATSQSS